MTTRDEARLRQYVVTFRPRGCGALVGAVTGGLLWLATNVLVVQGGEVVGPHLALLSAYFPGYSVTLAGSFVGAVYGFVTGYAIGFLICRVYNLLVRRIYLGRRSH